jgi:transcriptional regulator with AAA-type ATPase domain
MALLEGKERAVAEAMSRLTGANPFLPERIAYEREALGGRFVATRAVWAVDADLGGLNPNLARLEELAADLLPRLRERLAGGAEATPEEQAAYEDLVLYRLYARYERDWLDLMHRDADGRCHKAARFDAFARDVAWFLEVPGLTLETRRDAAFLFAYGFQTRRAFHHTFRQIVGASMPAARLRAQAWQSIFSHDRGRYRRALVDRMQDVTTLITGPSGTGKELVARAIGLSRFVPFDGETGRFVESYAIGFFPLNLSALSPTLIESELFGHRRGAFTGALEDRAGWLEACGPRGTVFLDEVGELSPEIQVKLLRVLQDRRFQRLGETRERLFEGKIVAATNRDLAGEMQRGAFREDFYWRLCSDWIRTPSLREQLADTPEDRRNLVVVLARRSFGADEAEDVADEVEAWIDAHLGADYPWPGNIRELEQCVRSIVIRRTYEPPRGRAAGATPCADAPRSALAAEVAGGGLDTETLLARYTALVYHATGSYEEAARRLGIDRRTVKARLDRAFLAALREADRSGPEAAAGG